MNQNLEQSYLMRILSKVGLRRWAWSVRRIHCPVSQKALVLDVGSGGNPYPRANVLLDAYEESRERHWVPLVTDRPTVLSFAEQLPFKDKAFDYVIASHVLEHSPEPENFLNELQRVASAGYIEVPDAYMERTNPYRDHRLEITVRDKRMIIRKKTSWKTDTDLVEMYENRVKKVITSETMRRHPFEFHVRYYWEDKIDYEIINPEDDASWKAPASPSNDRRSFSNSEKFRQTTHKIWRYLFSQRRRNASLDLINLLVCPVCKAEQLKLINELIQCPDCGKTFPFCNGTVLMQKAEKTMISTEN